MKPYVIKQGDYLEKIAHALNFDADMVWNDPRNAALKQQRDPNLLHPGDVIYFPERPRERLPLKVGAHNLFVASIPRTVVHLTLKRGDEPCANEPYVILGMGAPEEGTTDASGALEAHVPVHVRELQVTMLKTNVTYPVRVGDLDPADEPTGLIKRLRHLGYDDFDADSEVDADGRRTRAIRDFQEEHGLPVTGLLDDATKSEIVKAHGC